MPPIYFLGAMVGVTLLAAAVHGAMRFSHKRNLRRLAHDWRMHYLDRDLFNLAGRIAPAIDVPAASDVRIIDVIYGSEAGQHRYIFTAEYTLGVVSSHRRQQRVMSLIEPMDPAGGSAARGALQVAAAPGALPLIEQYRSLREGPSTAAGI
jgi:hypothetical protein